MSLDLLCGLHRPLAFGHCRFFRHRSLYHRHPDQTLTTSQAFGWQHPRVSSWRYSPPASWGSLRSEFPGFYFCSSLSPWVSWFMEWSTPALGRWENSPEPATDRRCAVSRDLRLFLCCGDLLLFALVAFAACSLLLYWITKSPLGGSLQGIRKVKPEPGPSVIIPGFINTLPFMIGGFFAGVRRGTVHLLQWFYLS